ncbi:hypothetical protein Tco_0313464 [Tanacetum coccineum]
MAIPAPPPSPLYPLSSPLPQIPLSPPLPVSPTYPLGYRAAMIRMRAETPFPSYSPPAGTPPLLPIPLPTLSPPLLLPSTDHRADVREACLPPRKRLCFAFDLRFKVGESSSAPTARPTGFRSDYGFVATLDDEIMRDPERCWLWDYRHDTDEINTRLDDAQGERKLLSGRLNMLFKDRRTHARTTRLMEIEARMSREAWGRSMDASDLARSEIMSLHTTVLCQQVVITELHAADRKRQAAITEFLAADRRIQAQFIKALKLLKGLQTYMTEFQRQQGPTKGPSQPDAPEEASSTS